MSVISWASNTKCSRAKICPTELILQFIFPASTVAGKSIIFELRLEQGSERLRP